MARYVSHYAKNSTAGLGSRQRQSHHDRTAILAGKNVVLSFTHITVRCFVSYLRSKTQV